MEAKDDVRQGEKGVWRGVERTCPDGDSHRWSRIGRTMSHRDDNSVWCGAGVRGWLPTWDLAGRWLTSFAAVLWGRGCDWLGGGDGVGVTCAMLTNGILVLVSGHGPVGLKGGYVSYMCQHAVYGSRNVGDGVV